MEKIDDYWWYTGLSDMRLLMDWWN